MLAIIPQQNSSVISKAFVAELVLALGAYGNLLSTKIPKAIIRSSGAISRIIGRGQNAHHPLQAVLCPLCQVL
jgi:hypothetical protein